MHFALTGTSDGPFEVASHLDLVGKVTEQGQFFLTPRPHCKTFNTGCFCRSTKRSQDRVPSLDFAVLA